MDLHPFQREAVRHAMNGAARHLCVSPTGTGKSHIIAGVVDAATSRDQSILVLVHRQELLGQTVARLREFGFTDVGVVDAKVNDRKPITVGMAQTVRRRFERLDDLFDVVVLDEAHRDEFKVVHANPPKKLIGFTATPVRQDRPLSDWFQELRVAITYPAAIEAGYIVPARVYAPSVPDLAGIKTVRGDYAEDQLAERMMRPGMVGHTVKEWARSCSDRKTIVFAVNVAHATQITQEFQALGVKAALVVGETGAAERRFTMGMFRSGSIQVVVNVAVFIEGLDVADASCVVVARPTKSLAFWMQMAGRGCRAFPGKNHYRVMDHSGNVFLHGSPSDHRDWSLDGERMKKAAAARVAVRYCRACFYVFAGGERCPNCSAPMLTRPVKMKDGELVEVKPEQYRPMAGFINAYETQRRRAFAEANARGLRGRETWIFVNRALAETVALQRKSGQLIIPKNPLLLF